MKEGCLSIVLGEETSLVPRQLDLGEIKDFDIELTVMILDRYSDAAVIV